jgi:hypothetical protein
MLDGDFEGYFIGRTEPLKYQLICKVLAFVSRNIDSFAELVNTPFSKRK